MLKHLLFASAALALLAAPSMAAVAGSASTSVDINGSVAAKCAIDNRVASPIVLNELADDHGNAKVIIKSVPLIGGAWCNGTSNKLSVVAPPLKNSGAASGSFTNQVNYVLTTELATGQSVSSDGATHSISLPGPFDVAAGAEDTGTVTTVADTSKKLIAGSYTATVVITLAPDVAP